MNARYSNKRSTMKHTHTHTHTHTHLHTNLGQSQEENTKPNNSIKVLLSWIPLGVVHIYNSASVFITVGRRRKACWTCAVFCTTKVSRLVKINKGCKKIEGKHTHTHSNAHTERHTDTHTHTSARARAHSCTHTHKHVQTYTHTQTVTILRVLSGHECDLHSRWSLMHACTC